MCLPSNTKINILSKYFTRKNSRKASIYDIYDSQQHSKKNSRNFSRKKMYLQILTNPILFITQKLWILTFKEQI